MRNRLPMLVIGALVVLVAVYLAGYLPEHRQRVRAEEANLDLSTRLAAADARLRTADVLGLALAVEDAVMRNDFGRAAELSTMFFDRGRQEAASSSDPRLRDGLSEVLARRDALTSALARADPDSLRIVRDLEGRIRQALGYETVASAGSAG